MPKTWIWFLGLSAALFLGYIAGHHGLIAPANAGDRQPAKAERAGQAAPRAARPKKNRAKTARKASRAEKLFRERVRAALEDELADLAKLKQDFADHHHTFASKNQGFATMDTINNCDDCLIPFMTPQAASSSTTVKTSPPK